MARLRWCYGEASFLKYTVEDRLMVGQEPLKLSIQVRILVLEQRRQKSRVFFLQFKGGPRWKKEM